MANTINVNIGIDEELKKQQRLRNARDRVETTKSLFGILAKNVDM